MRSTSSDGGRVELPLYSDMFTGRETDRAAIAALLTDSRLVTLTGPPGVGKTRLAVTCARDYAEAHDVPATFVDLVPVHEVTLVIAEMAHALGVQPRVRGTVIDQLADLLGDTHRLVLIDNVEHVIASAPDIGALVARCPTLRVLATSRERLRLSDEREFPVPALSTPTGSGDLETLAANPSVALLVARARRADPAFALTPANASAVTEACVRLEGLPLALELAAARLKVLTPGELVFRLDKRMELLASATRDLPERQRALRGAIAWSHGLLSNAERALFRRLSVFVGLWSVADAEAVCAVDGADLLVLVESLLEKNLVRRITARVDAAEFSMLESLRQFAAEQLDAHAETESTRDRHAAYLAQIATATESVIGTPQEQALWWWRQRSYLADARAALEHCIATGQRDRALALVAWLAWHSYTRGDVAQGTALVESTLEWTGVRIDDGDALSPTFAATLVIAGVLAWGSARLERAEALLRAALRVSEEAGDARHANISRAFLGHVSRVTRRYDEAAAWHTAAATGFTKAGNTLGHTWAQYDLGLLGRDRGDLDAAAELLRGAVRDFRELDAGWAVACAACALGSVLCDRGDSQRAGVLLGEAFETFQDFDDFRGVAQCLEGLAAVACGFAAFEAAALLVGAAAAVRVRLGAPISDAEDAVIRAANAQFARALGADEADRLRESGRTMPFARAAELATAVAAGRAPADTERPKAATLTQRERQVAALVASGRTNRQIGKALGIAEKTVEVHLQHTMAKLGARSRAEVAAWAAAVGADTSSA